MTPNDLTASIGSAANARGITIDKMVDDLITYAAAFGRSSLKSHIDSQIAPFCDIAPYHHALEIPGVVDLPPAMAVPENTGHDAVVLEAATTAPRLDAWGSRWDLSVQAASKMPVGKLLVACTQIVQNLRDGLDESVAEALDGASLPADQIKTSIRAGVHAAAALATAGGGRRPGPAVILASESLRPMAAEQRWGEMGYRLVFSRFIGVDGRLYILPEASASAVLFPMHTDLGMTAKPLQTAQPGWQITTEFIAAAEPTIRTANIIRVSIA